MYELWFFWLDYMGLEPVTHRLMLYTEVQWSHRSLLCRQMSDFHVIIMKIVFQATIFLRILNGNFQNQVYLEHTDLSTLWGISKLFIILISWYLRMNKKNRDRVKPKMFGVNLSPYWKDEVWTKASFQHSNLQPNL